MHNKRHIAIALALLLLLISTAASAVGHVTPQTPANPEIRASFGAWVEQALVPYLLKEPQEKWSAERCHIIADMVEAAGFTIADKYKDELYRTKREHRLYATEALAIIVSSQFGEYWEWTVEDKAWLDDVRVAAGVQSSRRFYAPTPSDGTTSEVIEAAREAICGRYDVTHEQWSDYSVNADFMAGGTDEGGVAYFWAVSVMEEWGKGYLFSYCSTPSTGEVEVLDLRK